MDAQERLTGWKQIAESVGCSVRTAQRLEQQDGLPVRRLREELGGSVFAYARELDAWRRSDRGRSASFTDATEKSDGRAASAQEIQTNGPRRAPRGHSRVVAGVCAVAAFAAALVMASRRSATLACDGSCQSSQAATVVLTLAGGTPNGRYLRHTRTSGSEHAFGPLLQADARGALRWAFSTDCASPPGAHDLWLSDAETKESTNTLRVTLSSEPRCLQPTADLVAEGVTLDRAVLRVGDPIAIRFAIRNQGSTRAGRTLSRVRISRSSERTGIDDINLGDVPTPELLVGGSVALSVSLVLPDRMTPAANYFVWVVADNGSSILEQVSANNFARSSALLVLAR